MKVFKWADEVLKLRMLMHELGITCTTEEAVSFWEHYNREMSATWMLVPRGPLNDYTREHLIEYLDKYLRVADGQELSVAEKQRRRKREKIARKSHRQGRMTRKGRRK